MTSSRKPYQKLVSFTENPNDIEDIERQLSEGWRLVSIMPNHNAYLGILEKPESQSQSHHSTSAGQEEESEVYIPPRKKIKIMN
jgi:hypothetical protein